MSYKPLTDTDLGDRYTPRTCELSDAGEYVNMLEEQCRRANRLAEAVKRECFVDGEGYYRTHVSDDLHRALRAYLGDSDE